MYELQNIILSEISQSQKKTNPVRSHLYEAARIAKFRDRKYKGGCQGRGPEGPASYV